MTFYTVGRVDLVQSKDLNKTPINQNPPVVVGLAVPRRTLSCSTGKWLYYPDSFTYQWLRDGEDIVGETASTYLVVFEDAETSISCEVTAHNTTGDSLPSESNINAIPEQVYISVNPLTYVITIYKIALTVVQTTPTEIYNLSLYELKNWLTGWEDDEEGIIQLKTHEHETESTLDGVTYARKIKILDPYTITFEDGQYAVNLVGANSNIASKTNVNQVSVRPQNSAGLQIVYTPAPSALTIEENTKLMGLPEETDIAALIETDPIVKLSAILNL